MKKKKIVQVSPKLWIEVDRKIPDEVAVQEFLLKLAATDRKQHQNHKVWK